MRLIRLLLRECRDYVQYFVIPALAVVMPWWLAIRFFRLVAYVPFLYRTNAEACINGAEYLNLVGNDKTAWLRAYKVCQMVDVADVFLLATRGKGYWKKYIHENVSELLSSRSIIFFPHYGAGMWLLRIIALNRLQPNLLVNRLDKSLTAYNLLNRLRVKVLQGCGVKLIFADDLKCIKAALQNEEIILVSPDMPQSHVASFQSETELGKLNIMSQFFFLAERRSLAVINVVLGFEISSGVRLFEAQIHKEKTAEVYANYFARQTVEAIKKHPYFWRMMVMAPQVMLPLDSSKTSQ